LKSNDINVMIDNLIEYRKKHFLKQWTPSIPRMTICFAADATLSL
jgi:hypothetical protein